MNCSTCHPPSPVSAHMTISSTWQVFFSTLHLKSVLETHVVTPEKMGGIPCRFVDARKFESPTLELRQKNDQGMSNKVLDPPLVSRTKRIVILIPFYIEYSRFKFQFYRSNTHTIMRGILYLSILAT